MKFANALQRMRRWSQDGAPSPGPERISVFLTNKCNLNCRHCWRKWAVWDRSGDSELSDARWLRLVDEAAEMDTRHWIFLGGGEPMVRRTLMLQMLQKMAAYGMTSWIHTNGTLFTPEIIEAMMDKNIQKVIFSIDGPDAAINDYIRGKGFAKALENMRLFAAQKQKNALTAPDLLLNATITNLTHDKLGRFAELAASVAPDVKVFLSALIAEDDETGKLALSAEQKRSFPEMVHKGIARAKALGIETNFDRFLGGELIEDNTNMQRNVQPTSPLGLSGAMCYEPWLSAAVMPDGRLGPCCAFYDSRALSIRDGSLEQVWASLYMAHVREGMFNGRPPAYCVRCPSNLFSDKEEMRILLTDYLHRDREGAVARIAGIIRRNGAVLREKGLSGMVQRIREWRKSRRPL